MIRLNPLLGLVWVARYHSYAEAARQFPYPISQPGLHQQVRSLERDVGTALFVRVAKGRVVPTPAGRSLVALAEPFIEQLSQTTDRIRRGEGAHLRIQSSGLVLRGVVAPWAARLRRQAPDLELHIDEIRETDPSAVLRGETDILVDFVPKIPPALDAELAASASAYMILPTGHPMAKRPRPRAKTLDGQDFVAYPAGTVHRRLQDAALLDGGALPRRITEASTADSILALVAAGLGASLIPWLDPGPPKHRGVVAKQVGRRGMFPIHAVFAAGAQTDPAIKAALSSLG